MTTPQGVVEHLQYNFPPKKPILTLYDKIWMYFWKKCSIHKGVTMSISNISVFNIIYILSISLQIAGALLLLFYSTSTKRGSIIRRFVGKGLLTRKGDILDYNQDAYRNEYILAYLNKLSFGYIAIGYLINVFGNTENVCKGLVVTSILFSSALIMFLSVKGTSFLINCLKANDKITNKDLNDFGIKPDVDFMTAEDIDQLWENACDDASQEEE